MQCLLLFLFACVYFLYAYISYDDSINKINLNFFIYCMLIGLIHSLLWYFSSRLLSSDKEQFFMFVLLWDLVYMIVFYLTPVIFFGVNLDLWGILGVSTMICGLLIMKIGHHFN